MNPSNLKKNFFTGVIVLVPLAVVLWFGKILMNFGLSLYQILPSAWKFESSPFFIRAVIFIGTIIATFVLIAVLGYASKQYFGEKILLFFRSLIKRIPLLGTIYSALDQMLRTLTSTGSKSFNSVVFVQFPRDNVWAIAFVTGPNRQTKLPKGFINVFVPTVPNPTSGFHLILSEKEVVKSDMNVEEAFKTLLSFGIIHKDEK